VPESVLVMWIMVNDAVCRCLSRGFAGGGGGDGEAEQGG
jgi:hypothetical protein